MGAHHQGGRPVRRLTRTGARSAQRDRDRHRAVVDQADLHQGTELAAGHSRVRGACRRDQALEQPSAQLRRRRSGEAGPVARRYIGRERELADEQQAAFDIDQAAVHLALCVGKDAQLQ